MTKHYIRIKAANGIGAEEATPSTPTHLFVGENEIAGVVSLKLEPKDGFWLLACEFAVNPSELFIGGTDLDSLKGSGLLPSDFP